MSMIQEGWAEIIQSSNDPRKMFNAFMETATMPGNTGMFEKEYPFYIPPDAGGEEILEILDELRNSVAVDEEISEENCYQSMFWPKEYDDTHTDMEWQHLLATQLHKPGVEFRERMIKIAALAKSAIMAHDRNFD